MKKIILFLALELVQLFGFAQAPNISYPSGTNTYKIGAAIAPLSPTNNGGAVPVTIYGQVSTLFGGINATFRNPSGVAVDLEGNVYVADTANNRIRKITAAGVVTTLAGSGASGSTDGTGKAASFKSPAGVAVDALGNVYVADTGNRKIRKITAAGLVTTLAGSGSFGAAEGTGTAASFNRPQSVTVDAVGNVYVADEFFINKIRKITAGGVVTTLAGSGPPGTADGTGATATFDSPKGVAVDALGNVYVADTYNHKIRKITATGAVSTFAGSGLLGLADGTGTSASFNYPAGLAVDSGGNVYVADTSNNIIRKITVAGVVTTLAGSGVLGSADGTGTSASFNSPSGVSVDSGGSVYVVDEANNKIRKVTAAGVVTTFAGTGTAGGADGTVGSTAPIFYLPQGVAVDNGGNLYVADTHNHKIQKITAAGLVTTLAGNGSVGAVDNRGIAASFYYPFGLTIDSEGNVYVADTWNHKIRKITSTGAVTTLAGSGVFGSADGTGAAARFDRPQGVAVDAVGNVYVADRYNQKIRKITVAGVVTTLAGSGVLGSADGTGTSASFNSPSGVSVDSGGNVYVADTSNHKIRKITATGAVTTFAGSGVFGSADGMGTAASFNSPTGVAVDSGGNVYVTDGSNNKIRKITAVGVVTTLAGSGNIGLADGTGTAASFYYPYGVSVDLGGYVYIADTTNAIIRKILATGYVISPTLVTGLIFDQATGVISGTPTTTMSATNYTVTAYNTSGSSSTTVVIATSTLGTTIFNKQELRLYPNPAKSLLHIQTPNNIILNKVTIIDLTGKKVLEQTQNTSQVNVEHLTNGMYIIEAFSGKEKLVSKFVKE